jgi:hypothetical protein
VFTITAAFFAVATLLLGIIAVAVVPIGGWGDKADTVRTVALAIAGGGAAYFLLAVFLGRKRIGD